MDLVIILIQCFVGIVWGLTNVLMKLFQTDDSPIYKNLKFLMSFLLNQSMSIAFMVTLKFSIISVAVPITNSLTFVSSAIAGYALNNEKLSWISFIGIGFVLLGLFICCTA